MEDLGYGCTVTKQAFLDVLKAAGKGPSDGGGPHGGVRLGMGAGCSVRLRRCGRRAVDRGGSRRRAERLRKLRRF